MNEATTGDPKLTVQPGGMIPPGPRDLSPFGSMGAMMRDSTTFLCDMARLYGDVVKYRIAHMTWYQVNHPDGIHRILQENNRNYWKGELTLRVLKPIAGNGLFTNEGESWLRQRRLMQPTFHRQHVAAFGGMMARTTLDMCDHWEEAARAGTPLDVMTEMAGLTSRIATLALFGTCVAVEANAVGRAITVLLEDVSYRFQMPFYPPPSIPTPRNRRYHTALHTLDETIYEIINRRKQQDSGGDLLSLLMQARDEETGEAMSDKQLRDEVITLFVAGYETTAVAMAWTWYLLSRHPDVEQRLHAELGEVLGGRAPAVADLPNLPYTLMVIEEAMRLYPPAWITNREALADDEIRGYRIPAKAVVVISPYVMHHHPAYWEDPERFDPERFSPQRSTSRPHYAYFPFGGGPRQCIGKFFALMEAQLILATLAQRYRLRLLPGHDVVAQAVLTLRPLNGLPMIFEAREAA
ncbi:MAG: cytochrome P450 [Chloroflexia bacterium]